MRRLPLIAFFAALMISIQPSMAQSSSNRPSPPAQVEAKINGLRILVDYSRPSKKGREIFGNLEKYGVVWRTGANETTWVDFSEDVKINGQELAKGRYALYTIPQKDEWTIIFNKKWKDWGHYAYDAEQDVLRIKARANNQATEREQFTILISEKGRMTLAWDRTEVSFVIKKV